MISFKIEEKIEMNESTGLCFHGTILYAAEKNIITTRDMATKKKADFLDIGSDWYVHSMCISSDGLYLYAACSGNQSIAVDLKTKKITKFFYPGARYTIACAGNKDVFSGGYLSSILQWNRESGVITRKYSKQCDFIWDIWHDARNGRLFAAGDGSIIHGWKTSGDHSSLDLSIVNAKSNCCMAMCHGKLVTVASLDREVIFWSDDLKTEDKKIKLASHSLRVFRIAISADGTKVFCSFDCAGLEVYDIKTGIIIGNWSSDKYLNSSLSICNHGSYLGLLQHFGRYTSVLSFSPPMPFVVHEDNVVIGDVSYYATILSDGTVLDQNGKELMKIK